MAIPSDETVILRKGPNPGDPTEITINCPDKVGLGCDLTRTIFEFGLSVVRGDLSTDGHWCFLVFWVQPRVRTGPSDGRGGAPPSPSSLVIQWPLLKQRISAACPANAPVLLPILRPPPKRKDQYLLQVCAPDRPGFLNDVTQLLWEVELTIQKVNVSTSPDGKAIDLFFVTDNRDELPAKHRIEDICDHVREALGDPVTPVDCRLAGPVQGADATTVSTAMPVTVEEHLLPDRQLKDGGPFSEKLFPSEKVVSTATVTLDNSISPAHSMLQIVAKDRKGLIYDCLRTLKDMRTQVSYGRITSTDEGLCILDMFCQDRGKKLLLPEQQRELCERVKREVERPIRITVVTKGPDSELLIACPVEECGRGRPRVLFDVTSVLRHMEVHVFKADISRHRVRDRQWEVYRFILQDPSGQAIQRDKTRKAIEKQVATVLMG
eukprot:TRINITY_DN19366_c0_g1_i1.p1 TRINITY_DN19366_c0_g1~~TRINITY_DN19366_c0_g1_i1.p1  ORF type:complete len:436 (+),score=107.14 TRINITY_DN19366_c0_g1_i1:379-1686(+)